MITKQDSLRLQKDFKKIFVTKKDMNNRFDGVDRRLNEVTSELQTFKRDINDRILTSHSEIMGELKTIREEQAAGFYR